MFSDKTKLFSIKAETLTLDNAEVSEKPGEKVYTLGNLKITHTYEILENGMGARWVQWLENTSDENTPVLSDIFDCDIFYSLSPDALPEAGMIPDGKEAHFFRYGGSDCTRNEWQPRPSYLWVGDSVVFHNEGGRSSQVFAPFFELNRQNEGIIVAIGWSGQWQASVSRNNDGVSIKAGLQEPEFYLKPFEKIRTASILALEYTDGMEKAHNTIRKILREKYCNFGKGKRPDFGPLCYGTWGGAHSDEIIKKSNKLKEAGVDIECMWMDAGWYGTSDIECPNEFTGNWGQFTGDWVVNKMYHPDDLVEVAKNQAENGRKFMLWFEPERADIHTETPKKHPEWYLSAEQNPGNYLLNLGNDDARTFVIETVSSYIEKLGLSVYREDFNIDPLCYWQKNDEPQRKGMTEIKFVMGLYEFWDTILERFPYLLIDNCASGGRRIDIETMKRSMPMWRSDSQCAFNCDHTTTQCHNSGISQFIPYSGTGTNKMNADKYHWRSAAGSSITTQTWMYTGWDVNEAELDDVKKNIAEFKRLRPFMSRDYYTLVPLDTSDCSWTAWQFEDTDTKKGVLLFFRRPDSPFDTLSVGLKGLAGENDIILESSDGLGLSSLKKGEKFTVVIDKKRDSRVWFYEVK